MNRPRLRDRLSQRRTAPRTAYAAPDAPVPLTSAPDGRTHLIDATDHAHAISHRTGIFTTRCGRSVLATSLMTPPGPDCRDCHTPTHPVASLDRTSRSPGFDQP